MNPQDLQGFSAQTIDAVKAILGGDPAGRYQPGVGITKDVTVATGLVAYNLEPAAKTLVPVITPLRNAIPRVGNTRGGSAVNWKQITSFDTAGISPFTAEGTKGAAVSYTSADKSSTFATISKSSSVTFQAQWAGKSFEDNRAKDSIRLLNTVMIIEERAILGGRRAILGTVTAPTVAVATTGGSIADATYNVIVRAVTNLGRGKKSNATSTGAISGTGANVISASTPYVEGAVRYEWYVGTSGNEKLEATTQINSMSISALAGTGAAVPADDSADTLAFDGVIAQLTAALAQVRTLATGTAGTGTQLELSDIDTVLKSIWDNTQGDPDAMCVNSEQSIRITRLVLASNGGPTLYVSQTGEGANQGAITGGYRCTHYMNPVTGKPIPIKVHPYLQAGTILILSFNIPFAVEGVDNAIEIETRQEYLQLEYALSSPKWEYEVLVDETLKIYFVGGCGVIRNIAPSV